MADLSETAVVLPEQPGPVELTAFLGLMGDFGALTFQPVNRVTVVRTGDAGSLPDKDLLVIARWGTLGRRIRAAGAVTLSCRGDEPAGLLAGAAGGHLACVRRSKGGFP